MTARHRRTALVALATASLAPAALALPPAQASPVLAAPALATPARPAPAAAVGQPGAQPGAQPGFDAIGVRRAGTWILRGSIDARTTPAPFLQEPRGVPLAGDFDGDGDDSLALFLNGVWSLSDGPGGQQATVRYGARGDRPVIGDWDGDGREDLGVKRGGLWYLRAAGGTRVVAYGAPGDVPVVGDWDGDGVSGIGLRRGASLLLRQRPTGGLPDQRFSYGLATDRVVVGDWDHDGADSIGVFRSGSWFLRGSDGRTQTVAYGGRGDLPVVYTRASLAPGLDHRVVRTADTRVQVATLDLAQVATPRVALAQDTISGLERTTSMVKRYGGLLGVNGDFAERGGRPIHAFGGGATLHQYGLDRAGTALGFSGAGLAVADRPTVSVTLTPQGAPARAVDRFNRGGPVFDEVAAYTSVAATSELLPTGGCYATLGYVGVPRGGVGGAVRRDLTVLTSTCAGAAPGIQTGVLTLAASQIGTGGDFMRSLAVGQAVAMDQLLGFPGSTELLGASELLVAGGQVQADQVDRASEFAVGRLPRTAAGLTADGRLLLVVVDGRQPGWSAGMSLRQLATVLQGLGAVSAVNLDGGGSSTMVVSGLIVNRPSDGRERGVSSALAIAPRTAPSPSAFARVIASGAALRASTSPDASRALADPGSTGGLLEDRGLPAG